jgi:isoleucyl-tRNA synthetase
MGIIKDIVEASNSLRLKKGIKLKYALPMLNVSGGKEAKDAIKSLEDILKKMANVNKVKLGEITVAIEAKINYSVAGKKFGKDIKEISTLLAKANPKKLKDDIDKSGKAKLGKFSVAKDDIMFKESSNDDMAEFKGGRVSLDMKISPELKQEWFVKEFMRAVQEARKKLGLNVSKKIKVVVRKDDAFKRFEKTIKDSTGSTLVFKEPAGEKFEFEFEDKKYYFGVEL